MTLQHAYQFTSNIFQYQNVEVIQIPKVIRNKQEGIKVFKDLVAEIVLYGAYSGEYIEIGFVALRGWNLKSHGALTLPSDLKFKIHGQGVRPLKRTAHLKSDGPPHQKIEPK